MHEAQAGGPGVGGLKAADRHVEGVVEMMLDATRKYDESLTAKRADLRSLGACFEEFVRHFSPRAVVVSISGVSTMSTRQCSRSAAWRIVVKSRTLRLTSSAPGQQGQREFDGIVRGGKIELLNGELPDGTAVEVRIKPNK